MLAGADANATRRWTARADQGRKLRELDQLLNDPDVALDARRVWSLLAEVARAAEPPVAAPAPQFTSADRA